VGHGKIEQNPIREVKKLTKNNVRMRVLNHEEFENLVSACPDYLKPLVVLAFYTGMRKSEVVFLLWDEVQSGLQRCISRNSHVRREIRDTIRIILPQQYR
jgi:integrase